MKILKVSLSPSEIKALLHKDFLVRWRQKWLTAVQILWPFIMFLLPYLIRLKYEEIHHDACQFPTRQLPTARNTMPAYLSYICSIENKCSSSENYEEYSKLENAPMKPIIDIVQIFINDDRMFTALVELPEKANFIGAVTTVVSNSHFDDIRKNVEKVIALVPEVEKSLNGSFDIKKLFSDRKTFVKAGNLLCGHPFPNTETIPLVEDILYSEDFSKANQDELDVMPTKYCKRLYLDVTSTNYGKITWETIKPIIHGKILYAPETDDTNSIIKFANATFEELNRLKMLSVALEQILTKLHHDKPFQEGFDSLIRLAQSSFVRSIIGDEFDVDQIEAVTQRIRNDPIIYDVVTTIKNLLECFSVDRFQAYDSENELRRQAFDLNKKRLFYAAVYFNETETENVSYKFHMDTENTQPTIENKNRFWFPGPAGNMLLDMKYHRGFVQIKHSIDLGIIKHKKEKLREEGLITEPPTTNAPRNLFSIQVVTDDDDDDEDGDVADDWFTDNNETEIGNSVRSKPTLTSTFMSGDIPDFLKPENNAHTFDTTTEVIVNDTTISMLQEDIGATTFYPLLDANSEEDDDSSLVALKRQKRQNIFDFLLGFSDSSKSAMQYAVDDLEFFTKQFPYPAYTQDDFKTGIYLAQAIQCAFFLGLVAQITSCVRHFIWMRESRNSMIMRSMGLKPCSELTSWCIVTFLELLIIFIGCSIILYAGGMVVYTKWIFIMIFLCIFGACLIAFCYMCSTFFLSATIGAVATSILFFISFCPYIIVLLFDAKLNSLQNFVINLSFTTAFAHAWSDIMRLELQEVGLGFERVFREGLRAEYGFSLFMIVFDLCLYSFIGYIHQRFKDDEFRFTEVQREDLDASVGATLTNVTKTYNNDKVAVNDISLSFPRNQVTCLLGRNGAGKSTIIKMLTGQVVQTTGRVILSQAASNSYQEYDKIGVCSQDNILIPNLTAREHLELYAKIKLKHNYEAEVNKTLKSLNFGKYELYQASKLSGGYQRRLCVAIAFIGSPNVVILDEPCNGVDNKARKDIWDLIERLRKGRAVIFATHFLDEAEHLSDVIVIMKNGQIIAKHNPETLKNHCTAHYEVHMSCCNSQTCDEIMKKAEKLLTNFREMEKSCSTDLRLRIPYDQQNENSSEYLRYLEHLEIQGKIKDLSLETENLEHVFKNLNKNSSDDDTRFNGQVIDMMKNVKLKKDFGWDMVREAPLTRCEAMRQLFWKRLLHFSRNYRILLCVIVLPAIFEICAMWFVAQRLEDDFDRSLKLSRELYPETTQMLSMEKSLDFTQEVYDSIKEDCSKEVPCKQFHNSERSFYWILETLNDYQGKRYGGYSFNDTKSIIWYNNKGYHSMVAWLNDMNSYLLQVETNNTNYRITAYNEPWKLGYTELSTTSILRQAGDSCMAFILLIAFSLVVAVGSVYLVNERVKGEKLQQKLCGVDAATYWGVAFIWDFLIMILAILVCCSIILAFGMPVFTDRHQLWGLIVLALFFAFACIPAIHVFEKCFYDSSIAIVTIFVLNVIIPLFTMSVIVLLGVVGDSPTWDKWRYFLNHRLFLIFPQHALGDGLLEICKNYMVALVFKRYDIDSYKNPVTSDLLMPHFISLTILGILFSLINILIESGLFYQYKERATEFLANFQNKEKLPIEDLKIVSIQNSLKRNDKIENTPALKVENLCKKYGSKQYAVSNVTFRVHGGECFGLLGKNGAGKSTIFKMLSGQLQPNTGHIFYENPEISYCPQTNTLDSLLTVRECIEFYGHLRRITNIQKLVASILESFQLETYCNVLVKNLSGGNRRKLTVATSCCGRTSVVLMDEPTSDMDPVTRAIVYRTIDDLLAEKRAIVLTSHSISEIDKICHRIAVLKEGQMLTCSSPENLKSQYGGYYNVTVYCDQAKIANLEKEIRRTFSDCKDVQLYTHSIKFSIKIENPIHKMNGKENGIPMPEESNNKTEPITTITTTSTTQPQSLTLSELFHQLHELSQQISGTIRYAVNKCKLDAVFERIIDKSDEKIKANGYGLKSSPAFEGTASTGYIHNGFIETETVT